MRAYKTNVVIPESHQLMVEVPLGFRPGPAELILLEQSEEPASEYSRPGRLAQLAAELSLDPRPFRELSQEEKRARLKRIRGAGRGLLTPSDQFARRKAQEIDLEERKFGG